MARSSLSTRISGFVALAAGTALCGCSVLPTNTPFYISPPATLQRPAPPPTRQMVSVCYDGRQRHEATVKQMIDAACTDPQFLRVDHTGNCTILQPTRVTYSCSRVDIKVMTVTPPYGPFVKVGHTPAAPATTRSTPANPTPPPAPETTIPPRPGSPLLDDNEPE